jgi:hypothetical protein
MFWGAKIGKTYTLNTKITFILLFDFILPIFERFQKSSKIAIFEISYFWSKNKFFRKIRMEQNLENFKGYSMQKITKNNFEPFWSYINF